MALDFSSTKFALITDAVVYKRLNTKLEKQDRSELKALDENLKPSELSDKVKDVQKDLQTIYFRDPLSKELTQSALSSESIARLKEAFGSGDFYTRKDGSLILNGKAENFVSGWYGDIAYTREYLKADKNQDGFMEKTELDETKSGFMGVGYFIREGQKIVLSVDLQTKSYLKLKNVYYKSDKFAAPTLALELDKTLKNDKNLDGIIKNSDVLSLEELIEADKATIEGSLGGNTKEVKLYTLLDLMIRDEENLKLVNKLAQNDFDIDKLDEEELKKLKENFSFLFDGDVFNKEKAKEFYENLEKEFKTKNETIFKTSSEDRVEDKKDNFEISSNDTIELKQANEKETKKDLNFKDLSPVLQDIAKNTSSSTQSLNLKLRA